MPIQTRQAHLTPQQWEFHGITVGTVVDANDPQQMGRVRAVCLSLGDTMGANVVDIPWASYAAPFAGTTQVGSRGVGSEDNVTGPVHYGMWGIPKVGALVLIACLDGDTQTRIWIGCLPVQFATHTMPHGRFSYQDNDNLPASTTKPVGPIDTFETTIEPLTQNFTLAFGEQPVGDHNYEFASRAADFQLSGISNTQITETGSKVSDDADEPINVANSTLTESRQGNQTNRQAPDQFVPERLGPRNLDNMVTSIVSPGFHAFSMDDREENSRVRIRTSGGHQVIMDDSNERVYISTAKGENWIEIDEKGNIDIYTSGKISAHAKEDINFTTDSSFRVKAAKGIHLNSDKEVRVTADEDISIKTNTVLRLRSKNDTLIESTEQDIHLNAGANIFGTALEDLNLKNNNTFIDAAREGNYNSGAATKMTSGAALNLKGGSIVATGGTIDLNGPSAASAGTASEADPADENEEFDAFFTNRIPDHEPWGRVDTLNDTTIDPQFEYDNAAVGKKRRITTDDGKSSETVDIERGDKWRR